MKFKSKISYLGEKISILPRQMAEKLAVEVDVKKPNGGEILLHMYIQNSSPYLFC